jgi:fumarylacetoacetase
VSSFSDHVFGACLVNDWSARDIQRFESAPLGPLLGKSFLTSVSPWIVPLAALAEARHKAPARDVPPLPYLDDANDSWALDLALEIRVNDTVVSKPVFAGMYWTAAQQLAHLTSNGTPLRVGDLYASGTVSTDTDPGCLLELSWNGTRPFTLDDGTQRTFLLDGDTVSISATAPGVGGTTIGFGTVEGTVSPARVGRPAEGTTGR